MEYFFDGLEQSGAAGPEAESQAVAAFGGTRHGIELAQAFVRLRAADQALVAKLVQSLAGMDSSTE